MKIYITESTKRQMEKERWIGRGGRGRGREAKGECEGEGEMKMEGERRGGGRVERGQEGEAD